MTIYRRQFLKGLFAGSAALTVSACGGGGTGGVAAFVDPGVGTAGTGNSPVPTPPQPAPTPTPPPVPTLRGITIEQAEADLAAPFAAGDAWAAANPTPHATVTVRSADELQATIDAAFDVAANAATLGLHHRIECAWNGESVLADGPGERLNVGKKTLAETHLDSGGSITIAAASGYTPQLANAVYVAGRGLRFEGIGFSRRALPGENAEAVSAVQLVKNTTYPVTAYVSFRNCCFGKEVYGGEDPGRWVNGLITNSQIADYVSVIDSRFLGNQNALALAAKQVRVDRCDFRGTIKDAVALRGHTYATDYFALAWVSRSTFRDAVPYWGGRGAHSDTIQTGNASDVHQGYRILVTDVISHRSHKFTAENEEGATQGFFNGTHATADNQFVIRRSLFLCSSANGFSFFSPNASLPSFVDRSVFMRAGTVPSAFAPDVHDQDFTVGITGSEPAGGPWLLVTDTIGHNLTRNSSIQTVAVDPRNRSSIPATSQPEAIFNGRDFERGGAAVNNKPGKFGYSLPNESGSQAAFLADIWANFGSKLEGSAGLPNPSSLSWTG